MFTGSEKYAKILRHLGKEEEAIQAEKYIAEMKGVVEEQDGMVSGFAGIR